MVSPPDIHHPYPQSADARRHDAIEKPRVVGARTAVHQMPAPMLQALTKCKRLTCPLTRVL
jgi:hypothetical protein